MAETLPAEVSTERRCEDCGRRSADRERENAVNSVEFHGPGDLGGKVTGSVAVLVVLAAAILVAVLYFLKQHDDAMKESMNRIEKSTEKSAKILEGVIYVITKSQTEKEALNLGKPEIIREMEQRNR